MKPLILGINNRDQLRDWLASGSYVVACLCAAWCDTCTAYQHKFEELAALHPDQRFVWIDIEDQAEIVGDLDVDNFPTLLIQQHDVVCFFGTVQPDPHQAERLLRVQVEKTAPNYKQKQFPVLRKGAGKKTAICASACKMIDAIKTGASAL